ncbi:MAG: Ig-like domain-containing protein [Planctomycetota bacterium]
MLAGQGGIIAGDLKTDDSDAGHKETVIPGRIRLLASRDEEAETGADITVGDMLVDGAGTAEISAIAGGNLTVNGSASVIANEVPEEIKQISFARICLIAGDTVQVDAAESELSGNVVPVKVAVHGKFGTTGDIKICAGDDVIIRNWDGSNAILIDAKTSETPPKDLDTINPDIDPYIANADVHINAGGQIRFEQDGGDTYIYGVADNADIPIYLKANVSGDGSGVSVSPSEDIADWDKLHETFGNSDQVIAIETATLKINEGPCGGDCPKPPGNILLAIANPDFASEHMDTIVTALENGNISVLTNDIGDSLTVVGWTEPEDTVTGRDLGDLTLNTDGTFTYTPAEGYAETVSFEYFIISTDAETGETTFASAEVTIEMTNELPTGDSWLGTTNMGTPIVDGSLVTDGFDDTPDDGIKDTIKEIGVVGVSDDDYNKSFGGTMTYDGTTYDYDPETMGLPGYVGDTGTVEDDFDNVGYVTSDNADDRFDVRLWDGEYYYNADGTTRTKVYGEGTISVDITNELPSGDSWVGTTGMDAADAVVTGTDNFGLVVDGFSSDTVEVGQDTYSGTDYLSGGGIYGGEIEYDGTDWTYNADTTDLPGYVGDNIDDFTDLGYNKDTNPDEKFTVELWDGQKDYTFEQVDGEWVATGTKVYGEGTVSLDITNELPSGESWVGTVGVDAVDEVVTGTDNFGLVVDGFSSDTVEVGQGTYSGTDYLSGGGEYGGEIEYDGTDWTYNADTADLPGYGGDTVDDFTDISYDKATNPDEKFTVELWDGQYNYERDSQTGFITGTKTKVYGEGSVSIDITRELPSGDSYFGVVDMDTSDTKAALDVDNFGGVDVASDTYSGDDHIQSILGGPGTFGGTLEYDGSEWTYTPDTDLPGYVGDDDSIAFGDAGYAADEQFEVDLWDGQYDYERDSQTGFITGEKVPVYGSGTVSVDLTNELPSGDSYLGFAHMDTPETKTDLDIDNFGGADVAADTYSGEDYLSGGGMFGGTLEYDGSEWTYTPDTDIPGYVGDDDSIAFGDTGYTADEQFEVDLWDGQYNYTAINGDSTFEREEVYGTGTVSVDLTNTLPTASGDIGNAPANTTIFVSQVGIVSPVVVDDSDKDQGVFLDNLSIVKDIYIGNFGGKLEFDGTQWIYTPAPGHEGGEAFEIDVWDGQYDYTLGPESYTRTEVFGSGTVTVNVEEEITTLPAAPLPVLQEPEIEGCPVLMDAVAMELGITSETIQVSINRALAASPAIQPCDACARFANSAAMLRDPDGVQMAAMIQLFNEIAPPDVGFTPELEVSIAAALQEAAEEGTQYASVMDYIDAFADYVAILDNELGSPVDDSVVFVMEKHGAALAEAENPNVAAFIAALIQAPL